MKKKYPTEVGYYWVRYTDSGGEPFIVKVNKYRDSDRLYADPGACVPLKKFPVDWLSGKLEPPQAKEQPASVKQPQAGSEASPKLPICPHDGDCDVSQKIDGVIYCWRMAGVCDG